MTYSATVSDLTEEELCRAAHMMKREGGHFAAALAEAFFTADSTNKRILINAFGHIFERFVKK